MKKSYLFAFFYLVLNEAVYAQEQLITYHGQLRTLMSDNRLGGNVLNNDTLSKRRGAYGTVFLDLGISVKPSEDFKLLAEFRMRNIIGQGQNGQNVGGAALITGNTLIDTRMIFRQIRAEGNIKKVVQYQIGDIDLGLTKYTLYGNNETFYDYESEIFKQRRAIAHYENFQTGNLWRLQGATAKSKINFTGPLRRLDLSMFGARTKMNTGDGVPDRLVVGGKAEILQSKYLTLGGNWINMFDLPGTVFDTINIANNYQNNVLTVNYKITPYNKGNFELNIVGENGTSKNSYYLGLIDSTAHKKDFFIDAGIKAIYKPAKIELTASYINVGHNFTSPGAQTLRLRPFQAPMMLNRTHNNQVNRIPTIFERNNDETIYNQRLQTGFMRYNPVYGNVLPYGNATPNRKGLIYNLGRALDTANVLSYNIGGAVLSETVSEGDPTNQRLRKFMQVQGGLSFNVSKLIRSQKAIIASFGSRYEKTSRTGFAFANLSSLLTDFGLSVEVFNGLHILGGAKYIKYSGTEVITNRDDFGTINNYNFIIANVNQTILSTALKLDLSKNSFASVEYNSMSVVNTDFNSENYTMKNLFLNFTMRF